MNFRETGLSLREYNKWRRGRGRKYPQPGFPFDTAKVGEAIDKAVSVMSRLPSVDDFMRLEGMFKFCISESRRIRSAVSPEDRRTISSFRKMIRYLKSKSECPK